MADALLDTRIAEFSKRVGQDIKADRVRLSTNESNISNLTETVGIHTKHIENLTAAAQGKNFTFQTDADAAYSKLVPTGALPYAGVKSIGGKTVVWNQLIPDISKRRWNVFCTKEILSNGNVKITCNRESSYFGGGIATLNLINGHKYLYKAVISNSYFYDSTIKYNKEILTTKDGTNYRSYYADRVFTVNYDSYTYGCSFYISTPNNSSNFNIGDWVKIKSIMLIDLTLMFGAGNEPETVEEFEAMFPADYYEYNAGELLSAGVSEVSTTNRNLFNGKFSGTSTAGSVYYVDVITNFDLNDYRGKKLTISFEASSTISNFHSSVGCGNRGFSSDLVSASTTTDRGRIYLTVDLSNTDILARIDKNGSILAIRPVRYKTLQSFTATWSDLQIEIGDTATDYTPYKETTVTIPPAVQNLQGYGWSAGSAKNWIDWENRVYHREVASVDLGTLNWEYEEGNGFIAKNVTLGNSNKILCHKYVIGIYNYWKNDHKDNFIFFVYTTKSLYITETSITDNAAFKTAMSGVMLYYELATPELIDISDLLTADNLIEVESGGMLIFKNQHGEDFRIPVPSEVEHMIDIEEAL